MAWLVLILSGVLEAVWATALGASDGFKRKLPTFTFIASTAVSMAGLAYAMRELPTGTSYAVWVGIGAIGTAILGIVLFAEPATAGRLASLALILAGIIGLKLATPG